MQPCWPLDLSIVRHLAEDTVGPTQIPGPQKLRYKVGVKSLSL